MRTFAILKPDLVAYPPLAAKILERILSSRLRIHRAARLRIRREEASELYGEHRERFFFPRLLRHICSGPAVIMELHNDSADPVVEWRQLMGPSKFLRDFGTPDAQTNSIRWSTALSDVRNSVHGADSSESATRELRVFESKLREVDENELRSWFK
ncbi:NDK domain-containing protein [Aphelenchoides besseyi]|nr:NDK domain-containing protein [Aphelenchoides besseyi]KAI6231413.1 NDK domain-containing protein [Aphelenchoides besseyi]